MNTRILSAAILATALAAAPLTPAQAHGWDHHGRGGGLLFGAVAGIAGAAVALATLPFTAVTEVVAAPPPQPVYAAAPYGYYQARPQVVYSSYAPAYAYPAYGYPAYGYVR